MGKMLVRKPGGTIAILFGAPSRFAHEDNEPDEDSLQREQDQEDSLDEIYQRLRDGDEGAVHFAMNLARCLQAMAHAASRGDESGLRHWYRQGRKLSEEDEDSG
jgi:hypothetical protein